MRFATLTFYLLLPVILGGCKPRAATSDALAEAPPPPDPGTIVMLPEMGALRSLKDYDASIPLRNLLPKGQISLRGRSVPTYTIDRDPRDPGIGAEYIKLFKQDESLARLYDYPADGGTIESHTLNVFGVFREIKPLFRQDLAASAAALPSGDVDHLLYLAIALHDIGKPYALARGDRRTQHSFTVPLVTQILTRIGYPEAERDLVLTLISHDYVGEVLKNERSAVEGQESGAAKIVELATSRGLPIQAFWPMQRLFYLSDALAYPELRDFFVAVKLTDQGYWFTHASGGLELIEEQGFQQFAGVRLQVPAVLNLAEGGPPTGGESLPPASSERIPERRPPGGGDPIVPPQGGGSISQGGSHVLPPNATFLLEIVAELLYKDERSANEFRAYYASFTSRHIITCYQDTKNQQRFICACRSDSACKEFEARTTYFGGKSTRLDKVQLPPPGFAPMR